MHRHLVSLCLLAASCAAAQPRAFLTQIGLSDAGDVTGWHEDAARSGKPDFAGEGCAIPLSPQSLHQIEATLARSPVVALPPEKSIKASPPRIHLATGGVLILVGGGIAVDAAGQARQMTSSDRARVSQAVFSATQPQDCGPRVMEPL